MQFNDEDFEVVPKNEKQIFEETFLGYFELFKMRVNHLGTLSKGSLDFKTYFDMSLVQLRALCIESPNLKSNYTLQNYLKVHGLEEKASEVDNFFNQKIGGKITLREVIKVTTDKFIAHYDTITKGNNKDFDYEYEAERTFYRFLCEKDLLRKESGISLYRILDFMERVVNIIEITDEIENNSIAWSPWL